MRAWGSGDDGGSGAAKSSPSKEQKQAAPGKRGEDRTITVDLEDDEPAAKVAKKDSAPASETVRKKPSAQELDSELRAFFDGRAALKGGLVGKHLAAARSSEPKARDSDDPERLRAQAKEMEQRLARAKRFGTASPDLEAQEKKIKSLLDKAASIEEKAKDQAKAKEEKAKLEEEARQKKLERQKRFAAPATEAKSDPAEKADSKPDADDAKAKDDAAAPAEKKD